MAPTRRAFLAGLAASASADACTPGTATDRATGPASESERSTPPAVATVPGVGPVTPPAVWPQPGQHSPGHTGNMR
jgi:hypothetical protein